MRRRSIPLAAFVLAGLSVALLAAVVVSSFASSSPDGLERVAIDEDFADSADEHALAGGPLADYSTRGVDDRMSTAVAGLIGVAITFVVTGGAVYALRRSRRDRLAAS
jgi:hypothetical protein